MILLSIADDVLPWSAFRSSDYGFGKLRIINGTHLNWKQISDVTGEAIDEINIIKHKSGKPDWYLGEKTSESAAEEQMMRFKRLQGCVGGRSSLPSCDADY